MNQGVPIPSAWIEYLRSQRETGMDYHVACVSLHDGRTFEQVAIRGGHITMVRGHKEVPFVEGDIREIKVNHKKRNFNEDRIKKD